MNRILVVDDDFEIRELLELLLTNDGFQVQTYSNGYDALEALDDGFDLAILDVMMPEIDGIKLCRKIRDAHQIPILFLTAKEKEEDVVRGFSAGADDYVMKPFSYLELSVRVKALLRRYCNYGSKQQGNDYEMLEEGNLRLNRRTNEVYKNGVLLDLTEREYRILRLLLGNPGRIYTMEQLFEIVWEDTYFYSCSNTVMVHIRNLRKEIEDEPNKPKIVKNVWGKGYTYDGL